MSQKLQDFSLFCMKAIFSFVISTLDVYNKYLIILYKTEANILLGKICIKNYKQIFLHGSKILHIHAEKKNKAKHNMKKDHSKWEHNNHIYWHVTHTEHKKKHLT